MQRNRKKWTPRPTEFSEKLKKARTGHHGFTQKYVSEVTGVPRARISQYETGARIPSKKNLETLLNYYFRVDLISFKELVMIRSEWNREAINKHVANFPCMR